MSSSFSTDAQTLLLLVTFNITISNLQIFSVDFFVCPPVHWLLFFTYITNISTVLRSCFALGHIVHLMQQADKDVKHKSKMLCLLNLLHLMFFTVSYLPQRQEGALHFFPPKFCASVCTETSKLKNTSIYTGSDFVMLRVNLLLSFLACVFIYWLYWFCCQQSFTVQLLPNCACRRFGAGRVLQ